MHRFGSVFNANYLFSYSMACSCVEKKNFFQFSCEIKYMNQLSECLREAHKKISVLNFMHYNCIKSPIIVYSNFLLFIHNVNVVLFVPFIVPL